MILEKSMFYYLRFRSLLSSGFQKYNFAIRDEKTITNLSGGINSPSEVTFCGYILNPETMNCRPDFSPFFGRSLVHGITFQNRRNEDVCTFIKGKMLFMSRLKLDPLFLDAFTNSNLTIAANIFEAFYVLALRLDSMLDSLFFEERKSSS
jgi:hypothetical protein